MGVVLLLHAAHEASAACACVALAVLSLGRRGGIRDWALRASPLGLAAVLLAIEARLERPVLTAFARGWMAAGVQAHPLAEKLTHMGDFLLGPQGRIEETALLALVATALATFVLARGRAGRARGKSTAERWLVKRRFEVLAAVLFVAYAVSLTP